MKQKVKKHFHEFGKQELLVMLFFYIFCHLFRCIGWGGVDLAMHFLSSGSFIIIIPIQPLAVLIWVLYVGVAYVICLMFAYKKWDKERLYSGV